MIFTEQWYSDTQANVVAGLAKQCIDLTGVFVEIGCWEGKSSTHIARAIYPRMLLCVDTWQGNIVEDPNHPSVIAAQERDVFKTFQENMTADTIAYAVVMDDWRNLPQYLLTKIAFIHIDAEHDYQSVYDSLVAFFPLMESGGIMCGDDYLTASKERIDLQGGVEKAVHDFFDTKGIVVRTDRNLWWIHV